MEVMIMIDIWEFLKGLTEMNPLEFILTMIHPVNGPMTLWVMFILIVEKIQELFKIR